MFVEMETDEARREINWHQCYLEEDAPLLGGGTTKVRLNLGMRITGDQEQALLAQARDHDANLKAESMAGGGRL